MHPKIEYGKVDFETLTAPPFRYAKTKTFSVKDNLHTEGCVFLRFFLLKVLLVKIFSDVVLFLISSGYIVPLTFNPIPTIIASI